MTKDSLKEILESSNKNNKETDVTGLLIYVKDRFIQLLEGDQHEVLEIFDRIANDDRHKNVSLLLKGESENRGRLFKDWAMALKIADSEDQLEEAGFKNLMEIEELKSTTDDSHPGLIFMKYFSNQAMKHYELELEESFA